ncbi:MAG: asparagine synthetase B family protein, partial [Nitrososphaerales archaeon]
YGTIPRPLRRLLAWGLKGAARPNWDRLVALGPVSLAVVLRSDRISKLADVLGARGYREMYDVLVSQWPDPQIIAPGLPSWSRAAGDDDIASGIEEPASWMMFRDQMTYLPDDILVKVDRASMAVALEARVPFLDHRVVEFAARLPLPLKIRGGQGKWALRQVLYRYVDRRAVERPKQGFAVPLAAWLRGPLREWAEELLSESALLGSGVFDPVAVRRTWTAHQSGRESHPHRLWVVLMLQAWLRRVRERPAGRQRIAV